MNFDDLSAFVAVARQRSFSRASSQLRVAVSALSKRVQRLELAMGRELLVRHSKGVSLTSAGVVVMERAGELLDRFEHLERDVFTGLETPGGQVRIALPPATSRLLAPLVYERCKQQFPDIAPVIRAGVSDAIHQWLGDDELDLALMYNAEESSSLVIQPLLVEPLYVIAPSHDPVTREPIEYPAAYTLADLAHLPLLLSRRPHSIRVLLDRLCARYGQRMNLVFEVDGIEMLVGMVTAGHGVGIFGYAGLRDELERGELVAIPFNFPLLSWTLSLVTPRRDEVSPAVVVIRDLVLDAINQLIRQDFWKGVRALEALKPAPAAGAESRRKGAGAPSPGPRKLKSRQG